MGQFIQDGVNFNIEANTFGDESAQGIDGKLFSNTNYPGWSLKDGRTASKLFNAVEIDWNDAEWPATVPDKPVHINSTGDLINAVKWASEQGSDDDSFSYLAEMIKDVGDTAEALMKNLM